ncbi:MAG: YciI family protein [Isosphaeraceae bacterium]|nr:YciI family protein [Isosphaeraceae bacterium]
MAKFLFIYRESTESRPQPSPEEMQALQAAWYTWMQKFSAAIVPGGDGLKHSGRVLKAGLVTDGPYVEAKEIIVSFAVIQADDYDAALAIARACPPGHTIEIREFAGYA